ncbi:basic transcription factor 3-like isoform X1 [Quercus lobata]|uniref:basic transcription factor 3-like isoform X1 n=1 Tax=Quercus lobata TaxID=97700 RepID=UPI00124892E9|nr:basic transcription factor 3-like isoform X1 [Quercus lobata]
MFLGGKKGKKGIRHSSRRGHIYPLTSPVKPRELSFSCLRTAAAAFASTRFIFCLAYFITKTKMDRERLMKMAGAVRTGGKGSMRRKKKAIHRATTTDDKRLQSTLKRIGVNTIPAIEEVNIFKDDAVIQFLNPKVQASIAANTWVVSGSPQTKKLQDILPGIINQLGPDNLDNLRKLAEQFQKQQPPAGAQATQEEDDDEVPELVAGETFETAAEDGHTHTS